MSCESPALQNRSMSQVTQIQAQKYKLYQHLAEIKKSRSRKSTLLYLQLSDVYSFFSSLLIFLVMILRNTRCLLTLNLRSSSKAWMASQNIHTQFIKKANAISNFDISTPFSSIWSCHKHRLKTYRYLQCRIETCLHRLL